MTRFEGTRALGAAALVPGQSCYGAEYSVLLLNYFWGQGL